MTYVDEIASAIRANLDPTALPDGETDELFRLYALLVLALGDTVEPPDVHDAWVIWMSGIDPLHPALVPFEELDRDTAASDRPFVEAIRRTAHAIAPRRHLK